MTRLHFTIPGQPIGKGRPRFSAKMGRAYTPKKTRNWEAYAVGTIESQRTGAAIRKPVELDITAVFTRPQSRTCKHKRACRCSPIRYPHTSKPDADNVAKAVCDALEKAGVLYNDSQVFHVTVCKMVADESEQPHVDVVVKVAE